MNPLLVIGLLFLAAGAFTVSCFLDWLVGPPKGRP